MEGRIRELLRLQERRREIGHVVEAQAPPRPEPDPEHPGLRVRQGVADPQAGRLVQLLV